MKIAVVISLAIAALLAAGCKDKQAEDTAAIRAMMEKQQADAVAQQKRAAAFEKAQGEALGVR